MPFAHMIHSSLPNLLLNADFAGGDWEGYLLSRGSGHLAEEGV